MLQQLAPFVASVPPRRSPVADAGEFFFQDSLRGIEREVGENGRQREGEREPPESKKSKERAKKKKDENPEKTKSPVSPSSPKKKERDLSLSFLLPPSAAPSPSLRSASQTKKTRSYI